MATQEVGNLKAKVGLDAVEFNKGIATLSKQMQIVSQDFRNASAGLDKVGDAAEINRLKITKLSSQIDGQKQIVDQFREAHQKAIEQYGEGSKKALDYELKLKRAQGTLQNLEQSLKQTTEEFKKQTSQAGIFGKKMEEISNKLKDTGEKVSGIGEKMSLAFTAPIMAAGGLIAKGALDAEVATGKLQAQLGITAEEAADLGVVAQEVWKSGFGESINEATESVRQVRLNMGILAEDELDSVATGALMIANVFEADVKESTAAAGVMMKSFGINGQDALDLITTGFQKGGDYSGELIDTLREYSPQFATMGMSAEQMLGILISGAKAGAWNMDKVGDSMKEFNIRAQDGSKTTAEGFAAIGLNAEQMGAAIATGGEKGQQAFTATITALAAMKDPVQQNIAGTALFGTQWEDVRSKVITAMAEGVKGVGDFKGATQAATDAMKENNPGLALTAALREVEAAIGPALLPLADIIKNTIVPAIQSMAQWFASLSPEGQKVALAVAGIVAAIGPLMMVLGPIIAVIGSIAGALGAMSLAIAGGATGIGILTTAFPALGTAFAVITGPIGITIAAIAALVTGGVLLYKNWDTIKAKAQELWAKITEVWASIKTLNRDEIKVKIASALASAWESIGIWFDDLKTKTVEKLSDWWESVKTRFSEIPGKISEQLSTWWASIGQWFSEAPAKLTEKLTEWRTAIVQWTKDQNEENKRQFGEWWTSIGEWFTSIPEKITEKLTEWKTAVTTWYEETKSAIKEKLSDWWESIKAWFSSIPDKMGTSLSGWWNKLSTWFSEIPGKIRTKLEEWWTSLREWFSSLGSKPEIAQAGVDVVDQVASGVKENKKEMFDKLGEAIVDVVGAVILAGGVALVAAGINIVKRIGEGVSSLAGEALSWGQNIVQGMIDGMLGWIGNVRAAAENLADSVKTTIKNWLDIRSPSAVMVEFGEMVSQGLADGIEKRGNKAKEETEKIASAIKNTASKMLSDLDRSLDLTKEQFSLARLSLGDNPSEGSELSLQMKELGAESATIAERIEVLNEAYRMSVEATGENSDESKQLAYELAKEEIAQKKNQIQIANATKAKEKLSSANVLLQARMEDLSDELENLEGKHRIETAMLGDSANEASKYALEVRQGNETLGVAKERLDLVTAAYNNARITTGENSEETRNLYKELLEAKLSYEDLKSNISSTTDKMNEQINTAEDLKDRIVDLSRVNAGLPESSPSSSSSHLSAAIANSGDIPTVAETGLNNTRIGSDGLTDYTRAIRDSLLRAGGVVGSAIPGFAAGGLVSKPTLAMVGEQGETEGIFPLSKLQPMMSNALMDAMRGLKSIMSGLTTSSASVVQPLNIICTFDGAVVSRQLVYLERGRLRGAGA